MSAGTPQDQGVYGFWRPSTDNSPLNQTIFLIQTMLNRVNVAVPVVVMGVNGSSHGSGVGTVDVQPLVNMTTGQGSTIPHGTVYGLPWFRPSGGGNAFIADPAVGDIGIAIMCDRDISSVKATKAAAPPGSYRRFAYSDGVYFGSILAGAPTRAVILDSTGCSVLGADLNLEAGVFKVAGTQVVGAQQGHISPATGGGTIDAQCRAVQTQILSALQAHGLTA